MPKAIARVLGLTDRAIRLAPLRADAADILHPLLFIFDTAKQVGQRYFPLGDVLPLEEDAAESLDRADAEAVDEGDRLDRRAPQGRRRRARRRQGIGGKSPAEDSGRRQSGERVGCGPPRGAPRSGSARATPAQPESAAGSAAQALSRNPSRSVNLERSSEPLCPNLYQTIDARPPR